MPFAGWHLHGCTNGRSCKLLVSCNKFKAHLQLQTPKEVKICPLEMQKRFLLSFSEETLSQCSHKYHGECTLNGNEITVICLVLWKMLWDSQRRWLMEILTTSDMKNRQLRASLSTTLGIIHKLLVVSCAVYCNAFSCNSSAVMQLPGLPATSPLQKQIRGKPMALLKKRTGIFIPRVSAHNDIFSFAFFFFLWPFSPR